MPDEPQQHKVEVHATQGTAVVGVKGAAADLVVTRGLTAVRLAVLGIVVTIALGAAALAPGWWRLAAGVGAFALSCILIRLPWSRNQLMTFMHWLTGL